MTALGVAILVSLLAALTITLTLPQAAPAADVDPVFVAGNPSCESLGYDFGFKVDPPNAGTYSIDGVNTVTVTTDGVNFDWSSTLGMDAVIAKGGPNANAYVYDPPGESNGDTGLHSPINPSNGQPFGLSHIEFCFDYEVEVDKDANTSFKRTFEWNIDKSVTPATWDLFRGDSGTSQYTVAVTKTGFTDSDWAVSGNISVKNPAPEAATITGVSDLISGGINAPVDCGVGFPHALAAGATLECTYSSALPDGSDRTNTATVTTSGMVGGGSASAAVLFGDPTTVVNGTINVSDSFAGDLGSFSDSGSTSYPRTFACDQDEGEHGNTATIVETGQSDSASVDVNCYALNVEKNANTALTRTWSWTIDKSADQTNLFLSPGQLFQVNYEVKVDASSVDSGHAVSGNISVANPAPIAATINAVADIVSPDIAASVDCGVSFPYSLAAGGALNCSYNADLPNANDRTNTATASLQNYDYASDGSSTPSGSSDFSGSANVDFSNAAMTEIDECIVVSDTYAGVLGNVCAADAPKTFTYSVWFGQNEDADVMLECGDNSHPNTASFVTNDTGATGEDSVTVNANVACNQGCTLTPGYWKTHSHRGPAPNDTAWLNLGDVDGDGISEGADERFSLLSGDATYYQVLWTVPQGNVYYILAHAYIAAKLNLLDGASSTPAVDAAISFAANFFATKAPSSSLTKAQKNEVIAKALILDNYNNGVIGPGHCSE
jgi:hypothetical protein